MRKDHFTDEALANAKALASVKSQDAETFAEAYDFARCQRADGSFYGTAGQCRTGTPAKAKEESVKAPKAVKGPKEASAKTQKTAKADKATAVLEKQLAELEAKMSPMLDKGGLIKKGLGDEYSKLVDESGKIRKQLTAIELAKKNIKLPEPQQGPRKPSGQEKVKALLAERAQSEHNGIKRLIKDGFSDRDSGGRETIMGMLGLTDRDIPLVLDMKGLSKEDLYSMSNEKFEKLALELSGKRLKR
jgi:hypothetical protein